MKIRIGFIFIFIGALYSCAATQPPPALPINDDAVTAEAFVLGQTVALADNKSVAEQRWWYARFKINGLSDGSKQPDWFLDALLADQVCEPILQVFNDKIVLWRFHRRAVPDQSGHQFSLIFYTDVDTASAIYQRIQQNDVLIELLLSDHVAELRLDELNEPFKRPNVEDTSDPNWALVVQKSWPAFIMGVSATWLELINQIIMAEQLNVQEMELEALLALYERTNNTVNELWLRHGRHAFLHHLNALFGYRPIYMNY